MYYYFHNILIEYIRFNDGELSVKILESVRGKDVFLIQSLSAPVNDHLMENANIDFIIGGSNGISKEVLDNIDYELSFSDLTFPHGLFRAILLEQIYRGFKIINNETYHK